MALDGTLHRIDDVGLKAETAIAAGAELIVMPATNREPVEPFLSSLLLYEVSSTAREMFGGFGERAVLQNMALTPRHVSSMCARASPSLYTQTALFPYIAIAGQSVDKAHLAAARTFISSQQQPAAAATSGPSTVDAEEERAPGGGGTSGDSSPSSSDAAAAHSPVLRGSGGTLVNTGSDETEAMPTIIAGRVQVMAWRGAGRATLLGSDNPGLAASIVAKLVALRSRGVLKNLRDPKDYDVVMDVPGALLCKPTSADFTGALLVALCAALSTAGHDEPRNDVCVCVSLAGVEEEIKHGRTELEAPHASLLVQALQSLRMRRIVVPRGAVAHIEAVARITINVEVEGVSTVQELLRAVMPSSMTQDPRASTLLLELDTVRVYKLSDWDGKEVRPTCTAIESTYT